MSSTSFQSPVRHRSNIPPSGDIKEVDFLSPSKLVGDFLEAHPHGSAKKNKVSVSSEINNNDKDQVVERALQKAIEKIWSPSPKHSYSNNSMIMTPNQSTTAGQAEQHSNNNDRNDDDATYFLDMLATQAEEYAKIVYIRDVRSEKKKKKKKSKKKKSRSSSLSEKNIAQPIITTEQEIEQHQKEEHSEEVTTKRTDNTKLVAANSFDGETTTTTATTVSMSGSFEESDNSNNNRSSTVVVVDDTTNDDVVDINDKIPAYEIEIQGDKEDAFEIIFSNNDGSSTDYEENEQKDVAVSNIEGGSPVYDIYHDDDNEKSKGSSNNNNIIGCFGVERKTDDEQQTCQFFLNVFRIRK